MANEQYLQPIKDSDIARELQARSVEKRKENDAQRETIKKGLEKKLGMCFDAYINAIVDKALTGDSKAWELVRDTVGEKPKEQIEIIEWNKNTADEIDSYVDG